MTDNQARAIIASVRSGQPTFIPRDAHLRLALMAQRLDRRQ